MFWKHLPNESSRLCFHPSFAIKYQGAIFSNRKGPIDIKCRKMHKYTKDEWKCKTVMSEWRLRLLLLIVLHPLVPLSIWIVCFCCCCFLAPMSGLFVCLLVCFNKNGRCHKTASLSLQGGIHWVSCSIANMAIWNAYFWHALLLLPPTHTLTHPPTHWSTISWPERLLLQYQIQTSLPIRLPS